LVRIHQVREELQRNNAVEFSIMGFADNTHSAVDPETILFVCLTEFGE
jgi:hypothetical protein